MRIIFLLVPSFIVMELALNTMELYTKIMELERTIIDGYSGLGYYIS